MFADAVSYKVKKAAVKVVSGLKEDILQTRILYKILEILLRSTVCCSLSIFPICYTSSKKPTESQKMKDLEGASLVAEN